MMSNIIFFIISFSFLLRTREANVAEKLKAHILCSITFLEIRAVYEIAWENIAEPGRTQMTIWQTRYLRLQTHTQDT